MTLVSRLLNTLWILVLAGVLISAYFYQVEENQLPCILCLLQRLCMISVSIGPMLNLRYGSKPVHFSLSLASAILGASVSLRQISLHVCPTFSTFGHPVFGLSLYTWAFIVFVCSAIAISLLLFIQTEEKRVPKTNYFEKSAFLIMFLVAFANVITTFIECGFGDCH